MKRRIVLAALILAALPAAALYAADAANKPAVPLLPPAKTEAATQNTAPAAATEAAPAVAAAASAEQTGAHEEISLPHQPWKFNGMFGTYDRASMQRGLKVYREVCSACHSLKRVYYRNLEALGYDEGQVKNIASQSNVEDGPNDEGEMFQRPALPSDHFVSPYPNEKASKAANNGAFPPDLSLITKARHGGPDYVYGILTGFSEPPAGVTILPGQHWNKYMAGHVLAMPPPLSDGQVQYEDGSPQTVPQYASDVVNFLTWAADPYMEERKRMGIKVLIFLAVFAGIMYAVKRRVWADLH